MCVEVSTFTRRTRPWGHELSWRRWNPSRDIFTVASVDWNSHMYWGLPRWGPPKTCFKAEFNISSTESGRIIMSIYIKSCTPLYFLSLEKLRILWRFKALGTFTSPKFCILECFPRKVLVTKQLCLKFEIKKHFLGCKIPKMVNDILNYVFWCPQRGHPFRVKMSWGRGSDYGFVPEAPST